MQSTNFNPLISVIVPVYNTDAYLERCVESLIKQTYSKLEIILVDDGSTDNSGTLCDSLSQLDSRVIVIHKKNGGLSSARNAGLDCAKGEYIGFVDSDDWVDKNMYQIMIQRINETNTDICYCGRYNVAEESGSIKIGLCPKNNEIIAPMTCVERILTWDGVDSSAVDKLFCAKLFSEKRFPLGQLSEDVAIMYKVILEARSISTVSKPLYYYFHRSNSITTSRFNERKTHIVEHSKRIVEFVEQKYPELTDKARYFECVSIMIVYNSIVDSKAYSDRQFRKLLDDYGKVIKENYKIIMKYDPSHNRIRHRIKIRLMGYPSVFLRFVGCK